MLLFITASKNLSLGQCLSHRPWARAKTPDVTQALLFSCCMTSGRLIPPSFSLGLSFLNCRLAGLAWIICTVLSVFHFCGVQGIMLQMRSREMSHGSSECLSTHKLIYTSLHVGVTHLSSHRQMSTPIPHFTYNQKTRNRL